ncbi:carbohydrate binding family 9 domain-containing protein [Flavobacterium sp. 7A]|uniref:carbohydrate binding family 9 domain-containing protein n=1 Tax=Flavobacterium sp. 7A TaxID=2940571 RepID=UPI0022268B4E|nr:carbohydrate binding family 9 domain-containing protein [Flavobacterium sp. 7A]MCW2120253.1 hypothetical protein [Flavobacterium sp. 7A]
MTKYNILLFLIYLVTTHGAYSQKKKLFSQKKGDKILIDSDTTSLERNTNTYIATDFIMYEPDNGKPIPKEKRTEVKVDHDNIAIYVTATLYDDQPNKILKEMTTRDVFGASDHFSVYINGFNDGQQDYRFYVSAAGVQMDCIATKDEEDFTWDAIWYSKVKITDFGWTVEMKIPYAALRFSKSKNQTWGLNFMREIKRKFQKYTWNYIDTKIENPITQNGLLEGINNITPPTRLFFIPYTSAYYQKDRTAADRTFKAGLDIKYGINEAFTLDAILVPDFGQTKFDNAILNVTPFEQTLTENRPFFTEGTNLFTNGNLFYSRRIGGSPIVDYYTLQDKIGANEEITNYPTTVNLINAVKVSGRTKNGLGIGILNAVTQKTDATIHNTTTDTYREETVQPLTNYNVISIDQRFRQNSSISFINTNTIRNGNFRDANVTGLLFDLSTKSNSYNIYGDYKFSTVKDFENYDGYKTALGFSKTAGKLRYDVSAKYLSKDYDTNDLSQLFYTNYRNGYIGGSYRIVNPTKIFNSLRARQSVSIDIQNATNKLQEVLVRSEFKVSTLKNDVFETVFQFSPVETFDFYEPRVAGEYVYIPKYINSVLSFVSNPNRPLSITIEPSITAYSEKNRNTYGLYFSTKYIANPKLSLSFTSEYFYKSNDKGFAAFDNNDNIIFGKRTREILQNDFFGKYAITNKMSFNLTARYYWSYSDVLQFQTLQPEGRLIDNNTFTDNKNRNFNSWNFDLAYSWWFAPGSEISILYRNYSQVSANGIEVEKRLSKNFNNVFDGNLTNIFSIRLRYFIDYNTLVK